MQENFIPTLHYLFELEGFKSKLTGDPGGRTICGIAERYYPADVAKMANMTREEAETYAAVFYKSNFWDAFNCDALPAPRDSITFILAVNPGPGFIRSLKGTPDWKDLCLEAVDYYCDRALEGQGAKPCCMEGNCKVPQDKCKRRFLIGWQHGRIVSLWRRYK